MAAPESAPAAQVPAPDAGLESPPAQSQPPVTYGARAVAQGPFVRVEVERATSNVQVLRAAELNQDHPLGIADGLNQRLGSVTINDVQNNPLQPDLQYRGFTASPLLGTPQGVAVYQNGVRLNEPFGDVLQWDLVPSFAIGEAQLVPGTDPIYGLNALGGSLVLRMKDGYRDPGYRVTGLAGAWGRYQGIAEFGHDYGAWAVYIGASGFGEQGWRDKSPSSAQNLYADLRHRSDDGEFGVSTTLAHTDLTGNGPAPVDLLARDRSGLYTWPDITQNTLAMLNVDAKQRVATHVSVQGNAYFRHTQRDTLNGDAAQYELCPDMSGQLCDENGNVARDESGNPILSSVAYNAALNTSHTLSDGLGGRLQLDLAQPLGSFANHLLLGASYDGSRNQFTQGSQLGMLTVDRGISPVDVRVSGAGIKTDLGAQTHQLGLFVSDTFFATDALTIHAAARFNWLQTALDDRLGSALSGAQHFGRIDPALGVSYRFGPALTLFASYGESNRAPSAAELACADPNAPCRVPNAFISDPPLEQVVSRSVEVGLRGQLGATHHPWLRGSLSAFGTRTYHDIMFVAGSQFGTGYFQNSGQTQRVGLEATLHGQAGLFAWYASYTLLRATFESELTLPGTHNPGVSGGGAGDDEAVQHVHPGAHIPGLPTHSIKAGLTVRPFAPLELGVAIIGQSSQYYRGDEANLLDPINGYVILNAHATYQLLPNVQLFLRGQNVLDLHYATFGVLSDATDVLPYAKNPRFLGPGAPFGLFGGVVVASSL